MSKLEKVMEHRATLIRAHRMSCSDPSDPTRKTLYGESVEAIDTLLVTLDAVLAETQKWLDAEPIEGTEKSQEWYSLGKRHAAESIQLEISDALEAKP